MKFMIVVSAIAAGVIACPALAQSTMDSSPETGSLISRRAAQINGTTKTDARRTTREFGVCVLKRFPKYGERLALEGARLFDALPVHRLIGSGELWVDLDAERGFTWQ